MSGVLLARAIMKSARLTSLLVAIVLLQLTSCPYHLAEASRANGPAPDLRLLQLSRRLFADGDSYDCWASPVRASQHNSSMEVRPSPSLSLSSSVDAVHSKVKHRLEPRATATARTNSMHSSYSSSKGVDAPMEPRRAEQHAKQGKWRQNGNAGAGRRGMKILFCSSSETTTIDKYDIDCEHSGTIINSLARQCRKLVENTICSTDELIQLTPEESKEVILSDCLRDYQVPALPENKPLLGVTPSADGRGVRAGSPEGDIHSVGVIYLSNDPHAQQQHQHHHIVRRSSTPLLLPQGNIGVSLAPLITASIAENAQPGTFVTQIYAVSSSPLQYRITAGDSTGQFVINATGALYLAKPLDFEARQQYSLAIAIIPQVGLSQSAMTSVIVYIRDSNEYAPRFVYPMGMTHYQATVTLGNNIQMAGKRIVTVTATDDDQSATIVYSITAGNYLGHFEIAQDGAVLTTAQFTSGHDQRYELTVTATDSSSSVTTKSTMARLQITVLESSNDQLVFIPGYYTARVAEHSSAVPSLLQVYTVNRALSALHGVAYTLTSGNDNNMFSMDRSTGVLGAAANFDREKTPTYRLTVMAQYGNVSNVTTVTVTVDDINDSPSWTGGHRTFIVNTFNQSLKAGPLGTVNVIDADSVHAFKCTTLTNNNPTVLAVSPACEVSLMQSNPSAGTIHSTVSVSDGTQPPVNSTLQLHVVSVPAAAVANSLTFSVAGNANTLLQKFHINGFVSAVQQATGALYNDIYLLAIQQSARVTGHTDITVAVSAGHHSSFLSQQQLVLSISRNRSTIEQQLGTSLTNLPVDQCSTAPCKNYATCQPVSTVISAETSTVSPSEVFFSVPIKHGYKCVCMPGTTGQHCELSVDACYSQPCPSGTTCMLSPANTLDYLCMGSTESTADGSTTSNNTVKLSSMATCPCLNNGSCHVNTQFSTAQQCVCPEFYHGTACGQSTLTAVQDPCTAQPCQNGARCTSGRGAYTCSCLIGFQGQQCQIATLVLDNACSSNPCYHGSTCVPGSGSAAPYTCLCAAGFTGEQCTWPISACSSQPCRNGAACYDSTSATAGYVCDCLPGFHGSTCEQQLDSCRSSPCQNEGQCVRTAQGYTCKCSDLFYGTTCQYSTFPNLCNMHTVPCANAANCTQSSTATSCKCTALHQGPMCASAASPPASQSPCDGNPCQHGATCQPLATSAGSGFTCICAAGFTGTLCSVNIDECQSNPCSNYSTCYDAVNGYVCKCAVGLHGYHCTLPCPAGTTGQDCTQAHYACRPGLCVNGASCVEDVSAALGYTCVCSAHNSGDNCELTPTCATLPCKNGGTCSTNPNGLGYWCMCPAQYQGRNCQLTTISSIGTGFRALPARQLGARDQIAFHFRTTTQNGLLYFNTQLHGEDTMSAAAAGHSFVAIEIESGRLQATVQFDQYHAVRLSVTGLVADAQWHNVTLYHNSQYAKLMLDSGSATPQLVDSGYVTGTSGYLTLGLPVYLTGRDQTSGSALTANSGFNGCLGNLYINSDLVDLADSLEDAGTSAGCSAIPPDSCRSNPCPLGAECVSFSSGYTCSCPLGSAGRECKQALPAVSVAPSGYIRYNVTQFSPGAFRPSPNSMIQMQIRPSASDTPASEEGGPQVLWYMQDQRNASKYEALLWMAGQVVYITTLGGQQAAQVKSAPLQLADNAWHSITLSRHSNLVTLTVDKRVTTQYLSTKQGTWVDVHKQTIFVAGLPETTPSLTVQVGTVASFRGCVRDIRLNRINFPVEAGNEMVQISWLHRETSDQCSGCSAVCQAPYQCNAVLNECQCPPDQHCTSLPTTATKAETRDYLWYIIYIGAPIGGAVLIIFLIILCVCLHGSREDAQIKKAIQRELEPVPAIQDHEYEVTTVYKSKEDDVLPYSEEGGGEIRDLPFDIDLLLREIRRPNSVLSCSSSDVYPSTDTAMTSVCATRNQTACHTPHIHHPSNPNIFLASYTNSSQSTRPSSTTSSTTKLNMDCPDSRGKSRPNSRANRNERIAAAYRYQSSGPSTTSTSLHPSAQGSRRMSPSDSGRSTPQFYHSSPSLAYTPTRQQQYRGGGGRDVGVSSNMRRGKRHSPMGSSLRDSPDRSPPQAVRQAPQGIEAATSKPALPAALAAITAAAGQTSRPRTPHNAAVPHQHVSGQTNGLEERLQRRIQRSTQESTPVSSDRAYHYATESEVDTHDGRLEEDLCPSPPSRHIADPRSLGNDFANISQLFDYEREPATRAGPSRSRQRQ
eukprot:scpid4789/ scgid4721/ Neurogenic locus notch homolog protein 1